MAASLSGPMGSASGAHLARVCVAPGKDIGHAKPAKPQGPRPPFAALNRGVVLHLSGGGGVEHNKAQPPPERIPNAGQRIAIPLAVGIDRDAGRIILDVRTGNHSPCWAIAGRRSRAVIPRLRCQATDILPFVKLFCRLAPARAFCG